MNEIKRIDKILNKLNINFKVYGTNLSFVEFSSFYDQKINSCTFVENLNENSINILKQSKASIILLNSEPPVDKFLHTYIVVQNPRKVFFEIVNNVHKSDKIKETYIHPTAIVSNNAKIGEKVFIGEYCIIGNCEIKKNTTIKSYTKIHDNVYIGENVSIHEYCNIGGIGFGHMWSKNKYMNQPHIGNVYIENNVEIFPYTNVVRGTLGTTKICKGTKIAHFCHISHECRIDENNLIMANSTICGSTTLGEKNVLGAGTMIKDNTKIGNNNFFGLRSSVVSPVNNKEVWGIHHAKYIKKIK